MTAERNIITGLPTTGLLLIGMGPGRLSAMSLEAVEAAKAANLNCLLTLPPWSSSSQNVTRKANACVNSLGNVDNPSRLIYGNKIINNYVDIEYLTNIIN